MKFKRKLLCGAFAVVDRFPMANVLLRSKGRANILMFHRVNDYDADSLTTPTSVFREMMFMLKTRYRIRSLLDLVEDIKTGRTFDAKPVVVTFDDGYRDNVEVAAPILKELGIPATFFVTSGYIGTNKRFPWDRDNPHPHPLMTWDEVRELAKMGFEIGAHSVSHANLGAVSFEEARREVRDSKQHIESELKGPVMSFAFPFGRQENCSAAVSQIAKEEGYSCCCNGYGGKVTVGSDPFRLDRISAYRSTIEMTMEIENFATYYAARTRVAGITFG